MVAALLYTGLGLTFALRGQRFWRAGGTVVLLVSLIVACVAGVNKAVEFLVLGGYFSLLASVLLELVVSSA